MPLSMVGAFLAGAVWLNSSLSNLEHSVQLLDVRMNSRLIALEAASNDRWHRSDMRAWARELKAANPSIPIPPVD